MKNTAGLMVGLTFALGAGLLIVAAECQLHSKQPCCRPDPVVIPEPYPVPVPVPSPRPRPVIVPIVPFPCPEPYPVPVPVPAPAPCPPRKPEPHHPHHVVAGASECLAEVNAVRAARGLPPFVEDPALTAAARAAADYRAAHRLAGHTRNDFAFLADGVKADAAGCAAWAPDWGWGACCTFEKWKYAGAAWTPGTDNKRYMHLFVRGKP